MNANLHDFTRGVAIRSDVAARILTAMTDEQIRAKAPSVFASEAHESRSARYAYIPTADILAGLRREGFVPVQATQSLARVPGRANFTKHQLKFTHQDATRVARVGDCIPQVCLTNSHDGSSTYKLHLGVWRLACNNGLMVSAGDFGVISVPHIGEVTRQVIEGAYEVIGQCKEIGPRIEAFQAITLDAREQEIFAGQALALRFDTEEGQAAPIRVDQVLRPRRDDDRANDLWTVFNRVQEHVVKGGQRYVVPARTVLDEETGRTRHIPARRMHAREVKGIDQNTGLNRALWRLAEEMRALKSAA